jgi:hypothetical protein
VGSSSKGTRANTTKRRRGWGGLDAEEEEERRDDEEGKGGSRRNGRMSVAHTFFGGYVTPQFMSFLGGF